MSGVDFGIALSFGAEDSSRLTFKLLFECGNIWFVVVCEFIVCFFEVG